MSEFTALSTSNPGNLMEWVADTPFIIGFLFLGTPALILSILGIGLIRFAYSRTDLERTVVGVAKVNYMAEVYAMVLGLFVVAAYESFQEMEKTVEEEALMLVALDRTLTGLPDAQASPLRQQLHDYVRLVVEEEWEVQRFGGVSSAAERELNRLISSMSAMVSLPADDAEGLSHSVYLAANEYLAAIVANRADRLAATPDRDLSSLYSNVLIAVTIVALVMPWFVFSPFASIHVMLAAALVTVFVSLIVLAVHTLYPFAGNLTITPEPFERILFIEGPT